MLSICLVVGFGFRLPGRGQPSVRCHGECCDVAARGVAMTMACWNTKRCGELGTAPAPHPVPSHCILSEPSPGDRRDTQVTQMPVIGLAWREGRGGQGAVLIRAVREGFTGEAAFEQGLEVLGECVYPGCPDLAPKLGTGSSVSPETLEPEHVGMADRTAASRGAVSGPCLPGHGNSRFQGPEVGTCGPENGGLGDPTGSCSLFCWEVLGARCWPRLTDLQWRAEAPPRLPSCPRPEGR